MADLHRSAVAACEHAGLFEEAAGHAGLAAGEDEAGSLLARHALELVRDRKTKEGLGHLDRHRDQISGIVQQVREIATKLHPPILDRLDLAGNLRRIREVRQRAGAQSR